ncbi:hypothetical protein ACFFGH_34260 [Lysobacter korlensis]|uniref:Uncharacterized protein n=1 Tax=Lysobacter korlensis TaxID=553636 RepID=A0ABV6S107_9GAMM
MSLFPKRVKIIQSEPFIAAVPVSARPPLGHFVLTELAIVMATSVSDATLGNVSSTATSFSRYSIESDDEAIGLDDFAKLLRQRSPFAIDKNCPVAELSLSSTGAYVITPLVRAGQGKTLDQTSLVEIPTATSPDQIGAAIRAALAISASSLAGT